MPSSSDAVPGGGLGAVPGAGVKVLRSHSRATVQVFVGTSGWHYDAWSKGKFYPSKLPASRWLEFYAQHFDTVEVNNTFYHLPEKRVFSQWRQHTPHDFTFAVKASRFITHMKKLAQPHLHVARFLRHARELERKLGMVLFQLPPFWKFSAERLRSFAGYLRRQQLVPGLRAAIEIRHATWNCEACFEVLRQHRVALAFSDWAGLPIESPVTADFVFVRRHGPSQRHAPNYPESALRQDALRVRSWLADGINVYVYFNNDAFGCAIRNAKRLQQMLSS